MGQSNRVFCRTGWLARSLRIAACVAVTAWAAPSITATTNQTPCSEHSASRQLDFWLGDWAIQNGGGSPASSKVFLTLDKCEVVESWHDAQGHAGENRFAYNYEHKSWLGMFADNRGHVHVFTDGKISGNAAEFYGPTRNPDGTTVLHRIRVTRESADKVDQIWEKSTDGGKTWTTVFRGEYTRTR